MRKRTKANGPGALEILGYCYRDGMHGFLQDSNTAFKLWPKAADLGSVYRKFRLSESYQDRTGIAIDIKTAVHHYQLTVMGGDMCARRNLRNIELRAGNIDQALGHMIVSARAGCDDSLDTIK